MSKAVYPYFPYSETEIHSQISIFPEGQFVAESPDHEIVGMSACLLICDLDYSLKSDWATMTSNGTIANHDPVRGNILYGVDTIVHPDYYRYGIAKKLIQYRILLARNMGIHAIRGGTRLSDFSKVAHSITANEYVNEVILGLRQDPALSFIFSLGFQLKAITSEYLENDPASLGMAAIVEYIIDN